MSEKSPEYQPIAERKDEMSSSSEERDAQTGPSRRPGAGRGTAQDTGEPRDEPTVDADRAAEILSRTASQEKENEQASE